MGVDCGGFRAGGGRLVLVFLTLVCAVGFLAGGGWVCVFC